MDARNFNQLSPFHKALVALAVLLDGHEGETYLANDAHVGDSLAEAATAMAQQPAELRMPFLGSMLRSIIKQLDA